MVQYTKGVLGWEIGVGVGGRIMRLGECPAQMGSIFTTRQVNDECNFSVWDTTYIPAEFLFNEFFNLVLSLPKILSVPGKYVKDHGRPWYFEEI